jgi:uncharacterized protein GlcG (DUF336 family)
MHNAATHLTVAALVSAFAAALTTTADAQLKTEKVLSYEVAKIIATTAVETCEEKGFRVSATVVDRNGDTVAQLRGDGASPHTMEFSRRKAYTANTFRVNTSDYNKRFNDGDPVVRQQLTLPNVTAARGGLPIKAGDDVIGGAAVSGSPGGNDEGCTQAGLDRAKDLLR